MQPTSEYLINLNIVFKEDQFVPVILITVIPQNNENKQINLRDLKLIFFMFQGKW